MSVLQRRNDLTQNISDGVSKYIASAIQNKSIKKTKYILSSIVAIAGMDIEKCKKCMSVQYIPSTTKTCSSIPSENGRILMDKIRSDQLYYLGKKNNVCTTECSSECMKCTENIFGTSWEDKLCNYDDYFKDSKQIKSDICKSVCNIEISDIDMENTVLVTEIAKIDDKKILSQTDIEDISETVGNNMEKKYGKSYNYGENKKKIVQIINNIKTELKQNISQNVNSLQGINVKGYGTVKGVHMKIFVQGVMDALIQSQSSIDTLWSIVNNMMEKVKDDVDMNFLSGFKEAWNKTKVFFIVTGIILFVLVGILLFLIFKRAGMKKNKKIISNINGK